MTPHPKHMKHPTVATEPWSHSASFCPKGAHGLLRFDTKKHLGPFVYDRFAQTHCCFWPTLRSLENIRERAMSQQMNRADVFPKSIDFRNSGSSTEIGKLVVFATKGDIHPHDVPICWSISSERGIGSRFLVEVDLTSQVYHGLSHSSSKYPFGHFQNSMEREFTVLTKCVPWTTPWRYRPSHVLDHVESEWSLVKPC